MHRWYVTNDARVVFEKVVHLDVAATFHKDDAARVEEIQFHRLIEILVEHRLCEPIVVRDDAHAGVVATSGRADRVLEPAQDMGAKQWFAPAFGRMAECRVECTSAIKVVIPGDRPRLGRGILLGAAVRRLVDIEEWVHTVELIADVVEFVVPDPLGGQRRGRRMRRIDDQQPSLANVGPAGMAVEITPYELAVPGPVILCIGSGVDSDVSATRLHITLQRLLLLRIQNVARRAEKYDGVELSEIRIVEISRILSRGHGESVLVAHDAQRVPARFDRIMAVALGSRKHQDRRGLAAAAGQNRHEGEREEDDKSGLHLGQIK